MINSGDVKIVFDPTENYTHATEQQLARSCGLLIEWLILAMTLKCTMDKSMNDTMNNFYSFGGGIGRNMLDNNELARIDDQGIFYYTGDPPQHPVMSFTLDKCTAYTYPHACLAWCDDPDAGFYMTRMD